MLNAASAGHKIKGALPAPRVVIVSLKMPRKPVVVVKTKRIRLEPGEELLYVGVYKGRMGIETDKAVYLFEGCPEVVEVASGEGRRWLRLRRLRWLCQAPA